MYAFIIFDLASKLSERPLLPNFLESIQKYKKDSSESLCIFGNVWIINLKADLSLLRELLDEADKYTISYKISYSENKPEFT